MLNYENLNNSTCIKGAVDYLVIMCERWTIIETHTTSKKSFHSNANYLQFDWLKLCSYVLHF